MSFVILVAYAVGVAMGFVAARSPAAAGVWPRLVRAQLLAASVVLSVAAAWRLTAIQQVLWPLAIVAVFAVLLATALLAGSGPRRLGVGTLHAWSATANTAYFVIPFSAAFAGPAGVVIAVLVDRIGTPLWAVYVWLLRRDAPVRQHRRTSWVDQSPALALLVGLALRAVAPAPDWTATVSLWTAPVLAATGAAVFVGSVLHPTQRIPARPGLGPWLGLVALRILLLAPIAWLAPHPVAVAAVLCALSIPAFGPPQFSTVYGYAEPVVAAGARYGWYVGLAGVVVGYTMTH